MAAKSSDNYLLIRRASGRFGVSDESASNAEHAEEHPVGALFHPSTIDSPRIRWHDTLEAARRDAHGSYAEYGVIEAIDPDHTGDTFATRLATVAAALEGTYVEELRTNGHEGCDATLHPGDVAVTVASPAGDWERVCEYTSWLSATTSEMLARTGSDNPS